MTLLFKRSLLLLLSVSVCVCSLYGAKNTKEAEKLATRLIPQYAENFVFEQINPDNGNDVYELESIGDKIVIRGNSANSMAVGLNYYLKNICKTSVSWYLADPIQMPSVLPKIDSKIRIAARMDKRFFLNYCTFGYTMVWWQWPEWERFIDWMALNGVNMPLAITGQEAVWHKVWSKFGLTDQEIRGYFTGPAYLPWHRMTNVDYWYSPLPNSWITQQAQMQKQIVERERALNMTPVLPAFAGHVPLALKRIYPDAKLTRISTWGGFSDEYKSFFLDPMNPLFVEIQKEFLKEQTKLYGTDNIYGVDPFNEINPPSWEPEFLKMASNTIYNSIKSVDPKAIWLQMTWLFYFDRKHWTNERIDAFVNGAPKDKMILLDYHAERTEIWKLTDKYFGQPYMWCYLGNFGGNTMLVGNMEEVGKRIEEAYKNGGENFWGIGSTLEALDVNPHMYEYVLDKAWDRKISDKQWIEEWADRRVGRKDEVMRKAWVDMLTKIYNAYATLGQGTLTNARPTLKGYGLWTTNPRITYSNKDLFSIWEAMLSTPSDRDSYLFDVVNIGRQVLGNHFKDIRDQFTTAYESKDKEMVYRKGIQMLDLLDDMDYLLSTHTTFLYGKWVDDASKFGVDKNEAAYYRENGRCLITTWGERGQSLNDYANRSLSGLTQSYYRKRWETFINAVATAMEQGVEFDPKPFNEQMKDFEQSWVKYDFISTPYPRNNGVEIAKGIMTKYKPQIK